MVHLELTFNPYKLQTQLKVSNKAASRELVERICGSDGVDLSSWSSSFFKRSVNEFNDNVDVTFNGLLRDYEFLEDALKAFPEKGSRLHQGKIAKPEDRLLKLKSLFAEMQRETPFEILKSDSLKRLFDRATNSEFEMAAVATMSSGKSTLINSFLGDELLPARAEATTATIARIHDVDDGSKTFRAVSYDSQGKRLDERNPLSLSAMNDLNDCPGTSVVEIYGKIPGISTNTLKLVLTDTPGPNNSRTADHQAHTYRLLKDDFKPMILYILNATALETNDDDALLRDVAEAMKTGGRQSRDRFIFVLNKADEFDPEKGEPVPKKIGDIQKYLEKHGITDARVFPADARMAKILRQSISGRPMTEKEEDEILPKHNSVVRREWRHFSDLAPLSPACKEVQSQMIKDATAEAAQTGDKRRLALIYTGVPAIELAIAEYLEKYALPAKIAKGVESFKSKIESLKIEADTKKSIEDDEQKLSELRRAIAELEKILEKKDMAKEVKSRIQALNVDSELKTALAAASGKLAATFRKKVQGMTGKVRASAARSFVEDLQKQIPLIQGDFIASIEKALDGVLRVQAQKCIDDYKNYVEVFLGSVNCPELGKIGLKPEPITIDEAIDNYVFEEDVKVGSHYEREESDFFSGKSVRSSIAGWLGVRSFLGKRALIKVDDWERQDFVEFDEYVTENLFPAIEGFDKATREIATGWATKQTSAFRKAFVKRLEALDASIRNKIREQKAVLDDANKRQEAIEENLRNLKWLNGFIKKLDGIIAV